MVEANKWRKGSMTERRRFVPGIRVVEVECQKENAQRSILKLFILDFTGSDQPHHLSRFIGICGEVVERNRVVCCDKSRKSKRHV
jgi:hypothetical protein